MSFFSSSQRSFRNISPTAVRHLSKRSAASVSSGVGGLRGGAVVAAVWIDVFSRFESDCAPHTAIVLLGCPARGSGIALLWEGSTALLVDVLCLVNSDAPGVAAIAEASPGRPLDFAVFAEPLAALGTTFAFDRQALLAAAFVAFSAAAFVAFSAAASAAIRSFFLRRASKTSWQTGHATQNKSS
eukprot:CAMPEP_0205874000 /NCGR_PEP_ID=MMETSP1083-20121108/12478_1 /ASSEMBLY_ACC=CAM_ASM_000430 /TAXON_ID=97485 /ORGANISM="Prymnesium parvum, Strain Texoma1" /LENGTH=184 /DNA_ID=CAMNT_0053236559 /DNA_START=311 /DNA_END=865 /DNA_ORIENTATION=-